jgi:SNF2 family DNA or RNA helicase
MQVHPIPTPFGVVDPSRRLVVLAPRFATLARGIVARRDLPDGRVVVDDDYESVHALRSNGATVPSPMMRYYRWGGQEPYSVQRATCDMLVHSRRAYVFSGMGVGKTKAAIWAFDYLRGEGAARRALVVAPLSILSNVWGRELLMTAPRLRYVILHGTPKQVEKLLKTPHDVAIINPDGVKSRRDLLIGAGYDTIIVDEASVYRNATSARWKALFVLAKEARYVWAMTGTPTPRAPSDGHGLLKLMYPDHKLARSFVHFRDHVMTRLSQFRWAPRDDAHDRLKALLQPAVRFQLSDVAELPETVYQYRDVDLGPKQREVYEALRKRAMAMAGQITAANAGALLNKLLQVATGAVYGADGQAILLDGTARLDALKELVSEGSRNFIVFVPFVALAPVVKEVLDSLSKDGECGPLAVDVVTGQTPSSERNAIFAAFQRPVGGTRRIIVAQPGAMAHGLTLTEADTIVWFGPVNDLEVYAQANARIVRPGQKHKTLIAHLVGSPVERRVYGALKTKQRTQDLLLEVLANPL